MKGVRMELELEVGFSFEQGACIALLGIQGVLGYISVLNSVKSDGAWGIIAGGVSWSGKRCVDVSFTGISMLLGGL